MKLYDFAQAPNPRVVGDKISIADITLLVGVGWAKVAKYELDPAWSNLNRWYEKMKARPSAKA